MKIKNYKDFKNIKPLSLKVSRKALAILKQIYISTFSLHSPYSHSHTQKTENRLKVCPKSIHQKKYVKFQTTQKTGKVKSLNQSIILWK